LAEQLGTVDRRHIGYKYQLSAWVPHDLTEGNKRSRMSISADTTGNYSSHLGMGEMIYYPGRNDSKTWSGRSETYEHLARRKVVPRVEGRI
jgi:hypothetical protein